MEKTSIRLLLREILFFSTNCGHWTGKGNSISQKKSSLAQSGVWYPTAASSDQRQQPVEIRILQQRQPQLPGRSAGPAGEAGWRLEGRGAATGTFQAGDGEEHQQQEEAGRAGAEAPGAPRQAETASGGSREGELDLWHLGYVTGAVPATTEHAEESQHDDVI